MRAAAGRARGLFEGLVVVVVVVVGVVDADMHVGVGWKGVLDGSGACSGFTSWE